MASIRDIYKKISRTKSNCFKISSLQFNLQFFFSFCVFKYIILRFFFKKTIINVLLNLLKCNYIIYQKEKFNKRVYLLLFFRAHENLFLTHLVSQLSHAYNYNFFVNFNFFIIIFFLFFVYFQLLYNNRQICFRVDTYLFKSGYFFSFRGRQKKKC